LYPSHRRWSDRSKDLLLPLFPGYLFCRLSLRDKLRVETTPSVLAIVGSAGRFQPIPESEICAIQIMLASGRPLLPHPYLKAGDFVFIHRGPLQGLEGILLQVKNIWRVVVSVTLLQRSVSVEVDRESVSPSPNRHQYATN
jgi:transcription antitermination factor NusG